MADIKIFEDDARRQYTATAGQTVFPYPFPIFDETHLVVLQDSATLVLATNYTVSGVGAEAGGNVTLLVGATVGDVITIQREMPAERLSDFQIAGDYNAITINKELDSLIMIAQQFVRDTVRSFGLSTEDETTSLTLPIKADRLNKFLAFDANGDPEMTTISPTSSAAASDIVTIPSGTLTSENQADTNAELDSAIVALTSVTGSFTATAATGFTTTPSVTWDYIIHDGIVTITAPILAGTSNAAGAGWTITGLPAAIQPVTTQGIPITALDNSLYIDTALLLIGPSGTINVYHDVNTGAWTNVNTKGMGGMLGNSQTFSYTLA